MTTLEWGDEATCAAAQPPHKTLAALRNLGVRLAIDDFGTGHSSLAYLRRFPVDKLMLDAPFVQRIGGEEDSTALVAPIVGMAHTLELEVVA